MSSLILPVIIQYRGIRVKRKTSDKVTVFAFRKEIYAKNVVSKLLENGYSCSMNGKEVTVFWQ